MGILLAGIGGIFGSISRYQIGVMFSKKYKGSFPWATFIINISGAVLLGLLSVVNAKSSTYILLGDGFLGAFTTFSTFMFEGFDLFRDSKRLNAAAFICLSLVLGILGYKLGTLLVR